MATVCCSALDVVLRVLSVAEAVWSAGSSDPPQAASAMQIEMTLSDMW